MLCSLGLSDPGSPPPSIDSLSSTWVPRFHLRIFHLFTLYTTINQLNDSFNSYQNFLVFLKLLLLYRFLPDLSLVLNYLPTRYFLLDIP